MIFRNIFLVFLFYTTSLYAVDTYQKSLDEAKFATDNISNAMENFLLKLYSYKGPVCTSNSRADLSGPLAGVGAKEQERMADIDSSIVNLNSMSTKGVNLKFSEPSKDHPRMKAFYEQDGNIVTKYDLPNWLSSSCSKKESDHCCLHGHQISPYTTCLLNMKNREWTCTTKLSE